MSHLQEQLSALVDGELNGAALDRANAHLAACDQCRAEAAGLRLLKRELRQLAPARPPAELTQRLLALAASDGPGQSPRPNSLQAGLPGAHVVARGYADRPGPRRDDFAERARRSRPPISPGEAWARRRRNRRLAWAHDLVRHDRRDRGGRVQPRWRVSGRGTDDPADGAVQCRARHPRRRLPSAESVPAPGSPAIVGTLAVAQDAAAVASATGPDIGKQRGTVTRIPAAARRP